MALRRGNRSLRMEALEPRLVLGAFYVATTGNDANPGSIQAPWRHLQHAIDHVAPGDTILVRGGTYNEFLEFHVSGAPGRPITLSAYPNERVTLSGTGLEWRYGISLGQSDYVAIEGLAIRDYVRDGLRGFGIGGDGGNDGLVLRDLDISLVGTAIKLQAASSSVSHNVVIANVLGHDYDGAGIDVGPEAYIDGLTIRDVTLRGPGSGNDTAVDGIAVEAGRNISIEDVVVTGHAGDGIDLKADNVSIRRATVTGQARQGIKLWGTNTLVENSVAMENGLTSLVLIGGGPYTLSHNLIGNSRLYGYSAGLGPYEQATPIEVVANGNIWISTAGQAGMLIYTSSGARFSGDNNVYYVPNRPDGVIDWAGHGVFSAEDVNSGVWAAASGMDRRGIHADPLLDANWRPGPASPAIDCAAIGPSNDREGNPRPVGAGYDAGPYERQSGLPNDVTPPTVTIEQAEGQNDPTNRLDIQFRVQFSETVLDFAGEDVRLEGTAGATTSGVTPVDPQRRTYDVAVSGMTRSGTVIVTIPAGVAHDGAGNPNQPSTSTDNQVIYHYVVLDGTTLTVRGTSSEDDFEFARGSPYRITFDGAVYEYPTPEVDKVVFEGGGGRDSGVANGSSSRETVELRPGWGEFRGNGIVVTMSDVSSITANGNGGGDTAVFRDSSASPGSDSLTTWAATRSATQTGPYGAGAYSNTASGFPTVQGYSNAGADVVVMHDGLGKDTFTAQRKPGMFFPKWATMTDAADAKPGTYSFSADGFASVHAVASRSGGPDNKGGIDTAILYDSQYDDYFKGEPAKATLSRFGDYFHRAWHFDRVFAVASQGRDMAELIGSPGMDKLWAWPNKSILQGAGFFHRAWYFDEVHAKGMGGSDLAQLLDSDALGWSGDDSFTGRHNQSTITGPTRFGGTYANFAQQFRTVKVYFSNGNDVADLYDSPTAAVTDRLSAAGNWAYLHNEDFIFSYLVSGLNSILDRVNVFFKDWSRDAKNIAAHFYTLDASGTW